MKIKSLVILLIIGAVLACGGDSHHADGTGSTVNNESAKHIKNLNSEIINKIESLAFKSDGKPNLIDVVDKARVTLYEETAIDAIHHFEHLYDIIKDSLNIGDSRIFSVKSKIEYIKSFENDDLSPHVNADLSLFSEILINEVLFIYEKYLFSKEDMIKYSIPFVYKEEQVGKDSTYLFMTNMLILNHVTNRMSCDGVALEKDTDDIFEYYKAKVSSKDLEDSLTISSMTTNSINGKVYTGTSEYGGVE